MNYIKQLNAFHLKIDLEPLSVNARSLWYTLTDINNRLGWREEFTVAASKLREKAGLTDSGFKRARKELEDNGFIQMTSRGGNQLAIYKMVCLYNDMTGKVDYIEETGLQHEQKATNNVTHNVDHKLTPLIKPKQKDKQNNTTTTDDAIVFFQENFGAITPYVANDMINWVNDLGEPLILDAMKRALERGKANWGYVKGILQAWVKKGITSVAAAQSEEVEFRREKEGRKGSRSFTSRTTPEEIVPDWFTEQKRQEKLKRKEKEAIGKEWDSVVDQAEEARILAKLEKWRMAE
ncbi:DnaD domain-containing protein [Virgibacillus necropolis]|uniref:DnaB/C C-terminal domain-containing protein n=1 Tax=Virgibacillus necropolis TaxID=163877 RepID=A0A221M9R4_9BACI|nr:DnaD domain protein [Virgibacillus necropolis]ASN04362.1 hypothetical protein CFK40_04735 [Virgibacillus necropolis]